MSTAIWQNKYTWSGHVLTVHNTEYLDSGGYPAPQTGGPALWRLPEVEVLEQDAEQSTLFSTTNTCLGSSYPARYLAIITTFCSYCYLLLESATMAIFL